MNLPDHRLAELTRLIEDRAADTTQAYAEVEAMRDVWRALVELAALRKALEAV